MKKQLLFLLMLCAFTGTFAQTPVATVLSGTTTFCPGGYVVLHSDMPTGNRWYKNGIATSGVYQNYTVTTSGTYTVKANNSFSNAIQVTVLAAPAAIISPAGSNNIIPLCSGSTISLTASDVGQGIQYLWNTGQTTRSINVSTAGTFWVTVTNAAGCSKTSAKKTTVIQSLPAAITASADGPTVFCAGGSVLLKATAASGYQWYRNGLKINGATSQNYVATSSGTFTVKAFNGTCYSVASNGINVTVNPTPQALISPTTAVNLCMGGTATLTASYAGTGGSYSWSTGATTRSIVVNAPGTYSVTVTNNKGCARTSAPKIVTQSTKPLITASGPIRFCPGGSVTLTCTASNSYLWSTGDTTQSITVSSEGAYAVTAVDAYGCQSQSDATNVIVYDAPTVSAGADQLIYLGYGSQDATLQATATGSGTLSYLWSTSDTTTAITVSPVTTTQYIIKVSNEHNCSDVDTAMVNVVDIRCGNDSGYVMVCHRDEISGQEVVICIPTEAVQQHLDHVDYLGACTQSSARLAGRTNNNPSESFTSKLEVFPNPFSSSTTLTYSVNDNSLVVIEVYNLLGSKVKTLVNSSQAAGEYQVSFDLKEENIEDGIYLIRFSNGDQQSQLRVLKTNQ